MLLSKISSDIAELYLEIEQIDEEIIKLRRRKKELLDKKNGLQRKIESSNNEDAGTVIEKWDTDGFSWSKQARKILNEKFKLNDFRPLQRAAINAVMSKEDAVVILSTGGGKSLCYQLPALLAEGLTLVVSPLISLVEDQIHQLTTLGIEAAALNASTSKEEAKRIDAAITTKNSTFRLLYVTPEKLAKSKRLMNKLEKSLEVGFLKLIAIDEVHCCSQWGHDFRTDYSFLNVLKRQFRGVPILGLTATATASVLDDVKDMLGIPAAIVFRAGFNRQNLKYEVVKKSEKEDSVVLEIAEVVKQRLNVATEFRFAKESGIVYCLSRNDCEKVAKGLREQKIRAMFYHAYMEPNDRSSVHEKWIKKDIQVIVATVAFGMGIDKPDVRFVIHHSLPKSIENYYQESGRAGRDGLPATCILFFRMADVFKQSTMVHQEKTGLANLYQIVTYASDNGTCRRVRLAEHFEESWEPSWCQKQCDVCTQEPSSSSLMDVTKDAKIVVDAIGEYAKSAKDSSGRITGNKLADVCSRKLSIKGKDYSEQLILHLLLQNHLCEQFHYTAYSVVSYVSVGPKWRLVEQGNAKVEMPSRSFDQQKKTTNRKRKASDSDDDFVVLD